MLIFELHEDSHNTEQTSIVAVSVLWLFLEDNMFPEKLQFCSLGLSVNAGKIQYLWYGFFNKIT